METAQRRAPDVKTESSSEESEEEAEAGEENETAKVLKMLAKVGSKPKIEIPMYDGSLNAEELMDWIRSIDQYFDYEEVEENKKVKFAVTRLKGHAAIWLNIRTGHVEDDLEKVARYINGLKYEIQDEISLLSLKTVEDAYQAALKAEEKLLRKQNQINRGKNPANEGRILESKVQPSQNEAGSASNRAPQRGGFGRGKFVPRGRGRGRDVRCFACGEWGHVQWDCPHQRSANQRNVNVAEAKEEIPQPEAKEEPPEDGESLLLKRVLLEGAKEAKELVQRRTLFRTVCKSKGKCCKLVIDSGSTDNLVSTEMVDKLKLERTVHPTPYKVSWLQKGHQIFVTEQCKVDFQIGTYQNVILCDIMPMDVCHILLGRPWKFDRNAIHDGRRNTYTLEKEGNKHTLLPLKAEVDKEAPGNSVTLMNEKILL
eukprot:PITA_12339